MPDRGSASDEERLPWLAPVDKKAAPVAVNKRGAGMLVGGVAALAAALTAGFYIGQRDNGPQAPPVEVALAPVLQAPVARPAPVASPPIARAAPPVELEAAPVVKKLTVSKPTRSIPRAARQAKIRSDGIESARLRAVRVAQRRRALSQPARTRAWPRMPSPGPAGQVIQLGAFRNPAGANRAYRMRLARYPSLSSMPRAVMPVATKPRGQVLYVLRLGTTSRQQSRVVCRNLRVSGDHCLVIG